MKLYDEIKPKYTTPCSIVKLFWFGFQINSLLYFPFEIFYIFPINCNSTEITINLWCTDQHYESYYALSRNVRSAYLYIVHCISVQLKWSLNHFQMLSFMWNSIFILYYDLYSYLIHIFSNHVHHVQIMRCIAMLLSLSLSFPEYKLEQP